MTGESGDNVVPFPTRIEPMHDRPARPDPVDRLDDRPAQPVSDPPRSAPDRHRIAASDPEPLWREVAGGIFRTERIAQGRTLGQIAERAGISPQYLSEVERGRKEPSSEMVESICGALGLSLADLLSAGGRWLTVGGSQFSAPIAGSRSRPGTPSGPTLMARLTG